MKFCLFSDDLVPEILNQLVGVIGKNDERFAAGENIVIRVDDLVVSDLFVQIVVNALERGRIADVLDISLL